MDHPHTHNLTFQGDEDIYLDHFLQELETPESELRTQLAAATGADIDHILARYGIAFQPPFAVNPDERLNIPAAAAVPVPRENEESEPPQTLGIMKTHHHLIFNALPAAACNSCGAYDGGLSVIVVRISPYPTSASFGGTDFVIPSFVAIWVSSGRELFRQEEAALLTPIPAKAGPRSRSLQTQRSSQRSGGAGP
jgi:hypothetical protein